jgi:hypothetical protein
MDNNQLILIINELQTVNQTYARINTKKLNIFFTLIVYFPKKPEET